MRTRMIEVAQVAGTGQLFQWAIAACLLECGMRTAIYPGSFDPLTNGHLDVIERASKLFDRVIVAIAINESKNPLFTLAERHELVSRAIEHLKNVEADTFTGLLVDYVAQRSGHAILRGL